MSTHNDLRRRPTPPERRLAAVQARINYLRRKEEALIEEVSRANAPAELAADLATLEQQLDEIRTLPKSDVVRTGAEVHYKLTQVKRRLDSLDGDANVPAELYSSLVSTCLRVTQRVLREVFGLNPDAIDEHLKRGRGRG